LLMAEDQSRAAFFNARYDELKRKRPAIASTIKDSYWGEDGTTDTSGGTTGDYDGGEW
jgi:hypothetical protein